MINGIIGRKIGMTQIFAADGTVTPVTVIKAGPCVVVQKKSAAGPDGYDAVQLGLVDEKPLKLKNVTKPMRGHFEKTGGGIPPTRILKEFRLLESGDGTNVGDKVLVDQFSDGEMVDVIGRSKGRGFAEGDREIGNCRLPIADCQFEDLRHLLKSEIGNRKLAIGNWQLEMEREI